jgi:hypothetical protein
VTMNDAGAALEHLAADDHGMTRQDCSVRTAETHEYSPRSVSVMSPLRQTGSSAVHEPRAQADFGLTIRRR